MGHYIKLMLNNDWIKMENLEIKDVIISKKQKAKMKYT